MTAGLQAPPRAEAAARASVAVPLALAVLCVAGAALRVVIADQSLFGDELSTYWIVSSNGLAGVVSTVADRAEITPPLSFVLSWLTTRPSVTPELLRLPSLVAGTATIGLTYLAGIRTVGRRPALVAAVLVAVAPFTVFYSTEARAYALAIALVLLSTLALLSALDRGGALRWLAYAACACAAAYTHYTSVFPLAVQFAWALWTQPRARRPLLVATLGAVVAFLPWLGGLRSDLDSPDATIVAQFTRFDLPTIRQSFGHWLIGHPYVSSTTQLRDLPGPIGLGLLAVGLVAGVVETVRARPRLGDRDRVALVAAMALAAPVGTVLASAAGQHMVATRNLGTSWPWLALAIGTIVAAAGTRRSAAAAALVVAAFAVGGLELLTPNARRPDYRGAAAVLDRVARPGDAVLDDAAALVTPGPLTGLEAALHERLAIVRVGVPELRDRTFRYGDPIASPVVDARRAAALAPHGRIFVVSQQGGPSWSAAPWDARLRAVGFRRTASRTFPGLIRLHLLAYARPGDRRAPPMLAAR